MENTEMNKAILETLQKIETNTNIIYCQGSYFLFLAILNFGGYFGFYFR